MRAASAPRRLLLFTVAVLIALFAFAYRFNPLDGRFGGFDNDDFGTLSHVDVVLDGEQPLRDFSDGDLRAVWPSLTYEIPAAVQRVWGRNLLVHARFTLGAIALCAAAVFLLSWRMSQNMLVALLSAGLVIFSEPRAYNYTKVFVLTVTALAVWWLSARPTLVRVALLAALTVMAGLFRHDYAVYVGIAALIALVAAKPTPWTRTASRVAIYLAVCFVVALPSLVWVQRYAGIAQYFDASVLSARAEGGTRRLDEWPRLDLSAPLQTDSLAAFNYYVYWSLPLVALGVLLLAGREGWARDGRRVAVTGVTLVGMALVTNQFFLRSNLPARFGDATVPVTLAASCAFGLVPALSSRALRQLLTIAVPATMTLALAALVVMNESRRSIEVAGLSVSWQETRDRFTRVTEALSALPPERWGTQALDGTLAVARYLAQCTAADDRVLVGMYADEIPYFSRRRFAGGQDYFAFGFLKTEADQRLALERWRKQSVPVAVTDYDYDREFGANYPILAKWLEERYREVGVVNFDGAPLLRVFVESARTPVRLDPALGFPCFR